MAISNINSSPQTPSIGSVTSTRGVSTTDNAKASAEKFAATIVTLSAQAIKLGQSNGTSAQTQTKTAQTQNSNQVDAGVAQKNQTRTIETIESAAAQAKETPPTRSRINTYA